MIVYKQNKGFERNSLFPNTNFTEVPDTELYIIDETTEKGQQMAQTYIENYPFVDFEYDENNFITKVIVLNKPERPPEVEGKKIELVQNENGEWEYIYSDIPKSQEEMLQETILVLGQEVTNLKVDNIQKDTIIDTLGQEVTELKLQLLLGGM